MSYISFIGIILVVILVIWSLVLNYQERKKGKLPKRSRLSQLRKKIDALPEKTDEDMAKKEKLYRELSLELLENIYGELEDIKTAISKKEKKEASPRKKVKKKPRKK